EQNMVQMTYWQFVARRLPGMSVENLFDQFEDAAADSAISRFKDSTNFFDLLTRYAKHLNRRGMVFKNIYFRDKKRPFFTKEKISELYYSFNSNYNLNNRIDATREDLIKMLNRKISSESKKAWVSDAIQSLSQEQLNQLYDRPDQEFESEEKEEKFLSRKIVVKALDKVFQQIRRNNFINMRAQYLSFLRAVPKMTDLAKWEITENDWRDHVNKVKESFKKHYMHMNDVSAYLYLYDLITGRHVDYEMRYAFIDEIQDYTPFQLCYLKYNFPRAKFTMLGDLNQAIFTKDESKSLLKQISGLFDPEKTDVVQLTKSYRSTKQLTDFTKQILRQGEKIESFNRQGPKPVLWGRENDQQAIALLQKILADNDQEQLTTAVITKDLEQAKFVADKLKQAGVKATLIATANQRLVEGTLIIPSYLAKGLEFDAVIMWGASRENYHRTDETQLVYTITSRAMYKLDVVYVGQRSPLLDVDPQTFIEK
ncbi:MAG: ATP-dependent DNA helicase, partial [Bombilactobacillus sp.]|nr:ATP-dependent DNA helicase [Bombilactobacillus sp.]